MKYCCDGRVGRIILQNHTSHEDGGEDGDKAASVDEAGDEDYNPRITQNSAYYCWKSFIAAWQRRSGETFSLDLQTTIKAVSTSTRRVVARHL